MAQEALRGSIPEDVAVSPLSGNNIHSHGPFHARESLIRPNNPEYAEVLRISKSVISATAGLDLTGRREGKRFIIDGYAYRPRRSEVNDQITGEEAIESFWANVKRIDEIGLPNLPSEWHSIRGGQLALAVYLTEEQKVASGRRKTPYDQYLEATSGFEPRLIPWRDLGKNYDQVCDILDDMGEKADWKNELSVRAVIQRRNKTTLIQSKEEIETAFRLYDKRNRRKLLPILGNEVDNVKFDFKWEETNEFWRFWETIGPNGERDLRSNWHERHRDRYDRGTIEMYAGHEPEHYVWFALITKGINEHRIDPAAGLIAIPGPNAFQLEGLAQTIGDLAEYYLGHDGQLAVALYRMEKRAQVNGLYRVEEGASIEEAAQEIRKYMPLTNLEEIKRLLREGTEKPFERAYLPTYGMSDYGLMTLRGEVQGINAMLPYWHSVPLTPDQFLNPPLGQLVKYE